MKRWIPTLVLAGLALALLVHGPVAQPAHYNEFADTRPWLGVANAGDVLSNAGFLFVGAWGLAALAGSRRDPRIARSWSAYMVFLAAIVATAIGSSYYHLAPDDPRLLWDRLPIAVACAGLLCGVHADTHANHPAWMLPLLALLAIASCFWWRATADLRPYLFFQFSLLVVPLWQWIHGSPRADRTAFGAALVLYAAAKAFEIADREAYDLLEFMSGHTIKHLLSVAAALLLAINLAQRVRTPEAAAPTPPR